jgi:hypothetical protein
MTGICVLRALHRIRAQPSTRTASCGGTAPALFCSGAYILTSYVTPQRSIFYYYGTTIPVLCALLVLSYRQFRMQVGIFLRVQYWYLALYALCSAAAVINTACEVPRYRTVELYEPWPASITRIEFYFFHSTRIP